MNDIAFHPVHFCLLATVGSDGKFSFWDKDARTKLKVGTHHTPGDGGGQVSFLSESDLAL